MVFYISTELEKKCYERCKVVGWNLKCIGVLVIDGVCYTKKKMLKYARDYVEKKLKEDPNNSIYQNEYSILMEINLSNYEKEFTIDELEKKCYDRCKKVNWNFDNLKPMDFYGVVFNNMAIVRFAKKYMIKNEPKTMDIKEIIFFIDDVAFSNDRFNLFYRKVIVQNVKENSELKSNLNFSSVLRYNDNFFIDALKMYCYDYCKEIDFEYNKINFLLINDVKYDSLMIWMYAKNYMLRHEPDCMDLKEILFFIDDEDRDFFVKCQNIINVILKEHQDLKSRINYSLINEYFKTDILKYCYQTCDKFHWNYDDIMKFCDINFIDFYLFIELGKVYRQFIFENSDSSQKIKLPVFFK